MDQANTSSTPSSLEILGKMVAEPSCALPSITDLGRHLAALEAEIGRLDSAHFANERPRGVPCPKAAADDAMAFLYRRADAIRELIATMRPRTVSDVAVQLKVAALDASILWVEEHTVEEMRDLGEKLERLILAAIPVLATSADLDPIALGLGEYIDLAGDRFQAMETVQ